MEEQKTIKDYIVDYLLDGEDEKRLDPVLVEWLAEDESHRKEFNLYKKIWEESHRYTEVEAFDPDLAWEKVDKINRQKVYLRKYWKNMLYTASGVAASLLIVLALSFMGTFQKGSEVLVSMSADYGNRSEIMLPDGSLNLTAVRVFPGRATTPAGWSRRPNEWKWKKRLPASVAKLWNVSSSGYVWHPRPARLRVKLV